MKKILIFSLAYYPHVGGAEVAIKEVTDRIKDFEWHIITLRFGDEPHEEKIGNVYVHRTGSGSSYFSKIIFVLQAVKRAIVLHREHHFGAMWAMMSYMLLPIVILRMEGISLPYVLTLQEGDTYEHMFSRLRIIPFLPLLSAGFRKATVVQTISTYLGKWARRRGFSGPLEIIPNGVDVKHFTGEPISHAGIVLITTSRLVNKNAIDDVIKALPLLPPSVRFKILGVGPDEAIIKELAWKNNVSNRVEFLGHINHSEMPHYLHASDIFIRPSRSEGMGNSFIEAMAAGIPVIATQEGGIADFLFDPDKNKDKEPTGLAVPVNSPAEIARQVKRLMEDNILRGRIIKNAKELVFAKYDWNLISRDMKEKVFNVLFIDGHRISVI